MQLPGNTLDLSSPHLFLFIAFLLLFIYFHNITDYSRQAHLVPFNELPLNKPLCSGHHRNFLFFSLKMTSIQIRPLLD